MNINIEQLASLMSDVEKEEMLRLLLQESKELAIWFVGEGEDKEGLVEAHSLVLDFVSIMKGNG